MKALVRHAVLASLGLALAGTAAAQAQSAYPERPIELLVGFEAGGPVDIVARQMQPFLEKYLGEGASVAVINRPGASGVLMFSDLANAAPDGYTMGVFSYPGFLTALFGQAQQPYSMEDYAFVAAITSEPHSLIVNPESQYETLTELVEAAKAAPGTVTIGGAGIGTAAHLAAKLLERAAGVEFNYIPSSGASEMVNQVMGGHIEGGFTTVSSSLPMQEQGQVRVLGIMSAERLEQAPDTPTFVELGYNAQWGAVRGIAAPAGTPPEVIEKWDAAVSQMMDDPEFLAMAEKQSLALEYRDGASFGTLVDEQYEMLDGIWQETPWQ